jgi:uncharacterized membrane protein YqaE (UPF0057 family)
MGIFQKMLKGVLDTVLKPLKPILDPIISMGEAMEHLGELIIKILSIIPKIVELFTYFTQPVKMLKDIFYAITIGIKTILFAILDILFGKLTTLFNINTDNSTDNNGKLESSKSAVCAKPNLMTFILLVLCPPLAVFTQQGLKGLFHVIVTAFLTCIYYFPGLIYASLILL